MPTELTPWKPLGRKLLLSVEPWFEIWREEVRLPDGRVIPDYYKFDMPDSCVVVALTEDQQVLVLQQYKHGVGSVIFGLPAGFLAPNEPPLQGIQRELLEETGYRAKEWIDLGSYVRDANRGRGTVHVFLALGAHRVAESNSGDLEEVQIHFMALDELVKAVQNDQVKALGLVVAVLLAKNHLDGTSHCYRK